MRTVRFRALGAAPLLVRSTAILPAVIAGIWLWPTGNTALALAVPAIILVGAHLLTLVPNLTIAGDQLVVRRFFTTERFDRAGVSLRLLPGRVLQYKTWDLVVVAQHNRRVFPWISWARHGFARPGSDPVPPPRAVRFVAEVERALKDQSPAGVTGDECSAS